MRCLAFRKRLIVSLYKIMEIYASACTHPIDGQKIEPYNDFINNNVRGVHICG